MHPPPHQDLEDCWVHIDSTLCIDNNKVFSYTFSYIDNYDISGNCTISSLRIIIPILQMRTEANLGHVRKNCLIIRAIQKAEQTTLEGGGSLLTIDFQQRLEILGKFLSMLGIEFLFRHRLD